MLHATALGMPCSRLPLVKVHVGGGHLSTKTKHQAATKPRV